MFIHFIHCFKEGTPLVALVEKDRNFDGKCQEESGFCLSESYCCHVTQNATSHLSNEKSLVV